MLYQEKNNLLGIIKLLGRLRTLIFSFPFYHHNQFKLGSLNKFMKDVRLLADPNSLSWDFAKKIQAHIQSKKEETIPLHEVSIKHFRIGEENMFVPENVRKKNVYFIHDSSKKPQDWWIQLLLIEDTLRRASAEKITFVLPNLQYSRKDWKGKPHVPISARKVAQTISQGTERIITMDLHSHQIQGFYNIPVDALESAPTVIDYLILTQPDSLNNLVVVAADAGAVKASRKFATKLMKKLGITTTIPIAIMDKTRIKPGEVSSAELIGDVAGKDVFIYEDMIDSGNTLISAAKVLREKGARKLMCYGTHGLLTNDADTKLPEVYDVVMVSNTVPQTAKPGVELIDMSPVFAEAIYRAQKGLSISKLFE